MSGTRQTPPLPCVEGTAHGKELDTRQTLSLPCAGTTDPRQIKDTRQSFSYAVRMPEEHTANKKHTAKVTCLPCATSNTHGKIFSKNLDSAIATFMGNLIFYVGL